jgi:hypothetical protein
MIKSPELMLLDEAEMRAFYQSFGFGRSVIERAIKVRQGIVRAAGLEPHAKTLRGARKSVSKAQSENNRHCAAGVR